MIVVNKKVNGLSDGCTSLRENMAGKLRKERTNTSNLHYRIICTHFTGLKCQTTLKAYYIWDD